MTCGSDPGADDAHPTLAQEAGTAVSAAVLRLAYLTGAQIVQAPPWPGASFTEEQPEPGAGIRIALALERQRAPGCVCTSPGPARRACPGTRSAEPWAWPS
jgi:hypothetical protein